MLDKIVKAVNDLGTSIVVCCILYGIIGLCLGIGALGLDYFLASTRLNFGG